jgi:hypothetical protein
MLIINLGMILRKTSFYTNEFIEMKNQQKSLSLMKMLPKKQKILEKFLKKINQKTKLKALFYIKQH